MIITSQRQTIYAAIFAALTAIGAFIKIPFPLVPMTMQTFFTLLAGNLLIKKYAFLSQLVYLILGLLGLPVFAHGGGIAYVLKPTFGYLLGMPIGAWFIASRIERQSKNTNFLKRFMANGLGIVVILSLGVPWLYISANFFLGKSLTISQVLWTGFLIFLPGDLFKSVVVSFISPIMAKTINHIGES